MLCILESHPWYHCSEKFYTTYRLNVGVPTGSAWSRPDRMSTVGSCEAAGVGAVATARGGGFARRADGRGSLPGPKP